MDDFTYDGVRNPCWAIRSEGVNLTGRMWIQCEVHFTSGPQSGRWSAIVIEHDNTESSSQNEIYQRCVGGEFGPLADLPPVDHSEVELCEMHRRAANRQVCIDPIRVGMGPSESVPD
ncbi:hypothetical protein [Paraburkholderia dipogonis]|uniref:hypothetical protein n=1 Tax=Paraburkholderia dipogonis TaxID=1211383 RepID=UPI0038BB3251